MKQGLDDSVVFFISISMGCMERIYEWNCALLIGITLLIYLNVEPKATARGLLVPYR
jgi:hypothetical protein